MDLRTQSGKCNDTNAIRSARAAAFCLTALRSMPYPACMHAVNKCIALPCHFQAAAVPDAEMPFSMHPYNWRCRSSSDAFVRVSELAALAGSSSSSAAESACNDSWRLPAGGYDTSALGYDCPLFARKFPRETAAAVIDLFQRCPAPLFAGCNSPEQCTPIRHEQIPRRSCA